MNLLMKITIADSIEMIIGIKASMEKIMPNINHPITILNNKPSNNKVIPDKNT